MDSKILPFYYPTTVVCIDDVQTFLDDLECLLISSNIKTQTYSNLDAAQAHLNRRDLLPKKTWLSRREDDEGDSERVSCIKFKNIQQQFLDQKRYEQISVMIVDYEMNEMNGLDFCKSISNPYTQKILLTGSADENFGINALNKGIIHQYIRKQDPALLNTLRTAVDIAQRRYFELIAAEIIEVSHSDPECILSYPQVKEFFVPFLQNAVEYYMNCATGSFVFLDNNGHQNDKITVKSAAELDADIERCEDFISPHLLEELKSRKKILLNVPWNKLETFCSEKLEECAVFAYALPCAPNFFVAQSVDIN